jgi:hypothetical protein
MVVRDCLLQGEIAATLAGFDERLRPIVEPRLWAVGLPNFFRLVLHELAHVFALGGDYKPLGAAGQGAIRSHGYAGLVADIDKRIEADPDLDRQRPYHSPANWLRVGDPSCSTGRQPWALRLPLSQSNGGAVRRSPCTLKPSATNPSGSRGCRLPKSCSGPCRRNIGGCCWLTLTFTLPRS